MTDFEGSTCIKKNKIFDRVENIMGKVENAGYQHFLLLILCFQKVSVDRYQSPQYLSTGVYLMVMETRD